MSTNVDIVRATLQMRRPYHYPTVSDLALDRAANTIGRDLRQPATAEAAKRFVDEVEARITAWEAEQRARV